ncbi:glycosyltransferase family 2 protein [Kocuria tytonis]|uniref:Glycosyltransferase family 2 protein n=1 Tax=Kocuria tytonis TaxID=2054280 RepID=A0A495A891_9MICC|nr:galactosyltransferase-related protein [Kocuria tytonis]RKQ36251.1 glycosyltransferase family 2 protein [Kocuria tytonis]
MRTALVTIASGRHEHLRRQREWVAVQSEAPLVHVVVSMGDPGIRPVVRLHGDVPSDVVELPAAAELPLATARNTGVRRAAELGARAVVLLDVDCLPHRDLVRDYRAALERLSGETAVVSGRVQYLPDGMAEGDYTPGTVARLGRDHAARVLPAPGELMRADPRLLWSLSMAVSVRSWDAAGGFDERYVGYGGEDTDFGQRLAAAGGAPWWLGGAAAYHQYHPTQSPPVQHAAAIARNANLFRRTWGFEPMEGWLRELEALGVLTRRGVDWGVAERRSQSGA